MERYEMSNQEAMELVFGYDPVKLCCGGCYKEYFVQCYKRLTYTSCADEKFEEE
jgi:hypothetical protein